jgi:pyrroline-5-carboxylate reductase
MAGLGLAVTADNAEAARSACTIVLATKPQTLSDALSTMAAVVQSDSLIISICAGISCQFIESRLIKPGSQIPRVIRTMPNTPMLMGAGIVGMAPGSAATKEDLKLAAGLFESCAKVVQVQEHHLDAVTALSGSGPAYFFYLVEQMTAAGIALGLPENVAVELARTTAYGSGLMLKNSPESAEELRNRVTSPKGTTYAAISHLQHQHWPEITRAAVRAAALRSKELGQ